MEYAIGVLFCIVKKGVYNVKISIGSRSVPKITAITRAFSRYPEIWLDKSDSIEYIIMPKESRETKQKSGFEKDTLSGVSTNPMSLDETILGAKNRAKSAYEYLKATRHL